MLLIAVIESLAWAAYNSATDWFGDRYGLKSVFLVVVVGFVLLNGTLMTLLYKTYPNDASCFRNA